MASLEGAEDIIDAVGVDVSVVDSIHIAPAAEGLPGFGMEVTVSEGWSNVMHSTCLVAKHVFGSGVSGIIPEVGVSGDSTLAPVGTVVDRWAPGKASGESRPMSASNIITGDVFLAITIDVSPCSP